MTTIGTSAKMKERKNVLSYKNFQSQINKNLYFLDCMDRVV